MPQEPKSQNVYRMLVVRGDRLLYLTMDPATGEMGLTDQLAGAAQFHPSAELAGSKVRKRIEYRAKEKGLLLPDEKLLMKPKGSIFVRRDAERSRGADREASVDRTST
ncbi:hypothetical protein LMG3441_03316 [Achromobacter kerstersii]|uniref:Uncharacterized protein n=1 Tax=Achromobacter kerstersii TaxID=1353890 RepID=A0A6S7A6X6_9BURK|nr:hypothetical protein LMG3441_03316 [Achromobacter kerstersii]